jgi:hypothetical protein
MQRSEKLSIPVDEFLALEERRRTTSNGGEGHGPARGRINIRRRTSLTLQSDLSLDTWLRIGQQICVVSDASRWWLGDWLVFGTNSFPGRYQRALEELSLDYQTLRNYAWVCRHFSVSRRRDNLSFQHHAEVAALPDHEQDLWLDRATKFGWSRNQLRKQLRQHRACLATDGADSSNAELRLSITAAQKRCWQSAADLADRTLAEWVSSVLDQAAITVNVTACD